MKKTIIIVFFLLLGINTIHAQEWLTNFEEVQQIATKEDKYIILVFAGSDWCAPCIKLEKQVLNTQEFKSLAKEKYLLIKADFPRKKRNRLTQELQGQNKKLAEKYNKSGGFPMVVVLDSKGKKLGELGYKKSTPKEYFNSLNKMIKI
ncbi:thioredoxin family protein [Aquimarina gracilis]|uniref:Thioredoxin family protein n=1 Tax=Aquimarina gracilis TaxID=874422 RepID=A0ABU5ZYK2_9FLAO|nr:thioredoxin family protein [Aquimarina gracilis]MEB3346969.1 thioredoxin family protein [Aquimarina gracilis]